MDNKTLSTIAIVGGIVLVLVLLMKKRAPTAVSATTGAKATPGSSTWGSIGSFLGGLGSSFLSGSKDSSSSGSGAYTWQGYDDSTVDLG